MVDMEYLTIEQAANELGRTLPAIYGAIREGRLNAEEKYGRKVVSRAELDGYKVRTATVGEKGGRPKNPPKKRGRPKKNECD